MKKTVIIIYDKATIGGGASKIAVQSAVELSKDNNYNVIFFAANSEIEPLLGDCKNIKTVCINTPLIADSKNKFQACLYGVWNNAAKNEFANILRELDPNTTIIHIHGWTKALSVSIIAVAQKMGFPVVITLHDYFSVCPNGGFYNYRTKKLCHLVPLSKECIKCNCDKRSYFQKVWRCIRQNIQNRYIAEEENINYIYISKRILGLSKPYIKSDSFFYLQNPIDLSENISIDHEKSNIFICAGRVSQEKGVEDFCKAFSILQKQYGIKGQVIGVGPLYEILKDKYKNIEFVGWANNEQMIMYYKNARALVFPSICNEGSPLTIPEALSAGLPCIVTDCTSAVETIIDGKNGLTYAAGDVGDLVSKIKIAIKDDIIDCFQKYISNTFECENYSYAIYNKNVKKIYDEILKKGASHE